MHLWADVERNRLEADDRRGFADLAQVAVHAAIDSIANIERKYIAHDYAIFELSESPSGKLVYSFETLENE